MTRHKYTDVEDKWLISNWDTVRTYQEITDKFNKQFNLTISKDTLMQHSVKILGLSLKGSSRYIPYSKEEKEYIKEQYFKCETYKELVDRVNDKFHNNRTVEQIRDNCLKRLNLPKDRMKNGGRFDGIDITKGQLPIGSIRKSQTGTYIKVKEAPIGAKYSGYKEPYWLPLQKKIYQDAYGEITENQMICFLDGNTDNFDLDNLYCIDRKISANMSTHRWWTNSREHTLTAIKWCELWFAMKTAKEALTNG